MKNPRDWYDLIAPLYDGATAFFYRRPRKDLVHALNPRPGSRILLPACGTGLSIPLYEHYLKGRGLIVCTDISPRMLERARRRVQRTGLTNVRFLEADAATADAAFFRRHGLPETYDIVSFELALTVIPHWKEALALARNLIAPGGRLGILDWYCPRPNVIARIVNLLAASDCTRPVPRTATRRFPSFRILKTYFGGYVFAGTA
ncbi:MAG: methyltransferase domain-containing protein [Chlorobi bacterium]|nr:methyltransferase domain-containing protein [Chlorobiota bacterium]